MEGKSTADPKNIREMNVETDFDEVEKIWLHGVKKAHKEFIEEKFWNSRRSTFKEETQDKAEHSYVYVEEDDKIRGFITVGKVTKTKAYIFDIYVDFREEDFRGKGIGTALFETLIGKNPKFPQLEGKYSKITSSVYRHNYTSFAWHIKRGFKVLGIRFCSETGLPKFDMIWEKETSDL